MCAGAQVDVRQCCGSREGSLVLFGLASSWLLTRPLALARPSGLSSGLRSPAVMHSPDNLRRLRLRSARLMSDHPGSQLLATKQQRQTRLEQLCRQFPLCLHHGRPPSALASDLAQKCRLHSCCLLHSLHGLRVCMPQAGDLHA